MYDSKIFANIIENIPKDLTLIFDRGYNSKNNIDLIRDRKYIGSIKSSDYYSIMMIPVKENSYVDIIKNVYWKGHKIILYHSRALEIRRKNKFMKKLGNAIIKAKKTMHSGNYDVLEETRIYLESENLNETIILGFEINQERLEQRLSIIDKNAVFTNINDMDSEKIIDLYRKRNRTLLQDYKYNRHCIPCIPYTSENKSAYVFFINIQ
ncbi:transposase [Ferroplasma sp.]|uniref:transposase n=1 Tax=Ferroplasma sp. TaxID=2591003 RepID=UPI00307F039E